MPSGVREIERDGESEKGRASEMANNLHIKHGTHCSYAAWACFSFFFQFACYEFPIKIKIFINSGKKKKKQKQMT